MDWIPVYGHDTDETVTIIGFECTGCGYVAHRQWLRCPKCDEQWVPTGKTLMEPGNQSF